MECNKDEAIRAKAIAEKKLCSLDFSGAHKFALKAQKLFPRLENIAQLLTVCEVHCSAQNTLPASQMNWYEILQLENTADESTVKRQYHKLAILLHPDKNKFAYAEAAFKMIVEANDVLSDHEKRFFYDMQYKNFVTTAAAAATQPSSPQPMKRKDVPNPPTGSNLRGDTNISSNINVNPNLAAPKYDEGVKEGKKHARVYPEESMSKSKPKADDGLNDTAEAAKFFKETIARQAATECTKKKASTPRPKSAPTRKRKSDDGTRETRAAVKALKKELVDSVIKSLDDYDNQTAYHHYEHVDNEANAVKRATDILKAIPGIASNDNLFMLGCLLISDRGRRNAFLDLRTDAARLSWLREQQSLAARH